MTRQPKPRRARALCVLAAVLAVIVLANFLAHQLDALLALEIGPRNEHIVHRLLMVSAASYTLLIAIPFVPGVELGLSLLVMFGSKIVFLVYLCTFAGLSLSFLAGRLIPSPMLQRFLCDLSLRRASAFVGEIGKLSTAERLDLLVAGAPSSLVPLLLRYRYLALALAFNIPGNALIGGGGGIALMAGFSRLFTPPAFLLTLALAISPVPLAVLTLGEGILLD